MAKTKQAATESSPAKKKSGATSQTWLHQEMIDWLEETQGVDMSKMSPVEILSLAFARHIDWRKTDRYKEVKEAHRIDREQAEAERKAAVAERKAAAKASKSEAKPEAKSKPKGKASSKSTSGVSEPLPKKGRKTAKSKASSEDVDPFA